MLFRCWVMPSRFVAGVVKRRSCRTADPLHTAKPLEGPQPWVRRPLHRTSRSTDTAWPETDLCKRSIIRPRFQAAIVCREDEP